MTTKLPFKLNTLYEIKVPEEQDFEEFKTKVTDMLGKWIRDTIKRPVVFTQEEYQYSEKLWEIVGTDWVVQKGELNGTLPKRLSSYFYKFSDVRLDNDILSRLGNYAGKFYATKTKDFYIDFVTSFKWKAGTFGEDKNSCFWSSHARAKDMIKGVDGMAFRFFGENSRLLVNGKARSWIIPLFENVYIQFNGYGIELCQQAEILKQFLKLECKKIRFTNQGSETGELYINGGNAYLHAESNILKKFASIDMDID